MINTRIGGHAVSSLTTPFVGMAEHSAQTQRIQLIHSSNICTRPVITNSRFDQDFFECFELIH